MRIACINMLARSIVSPPITLHRRRRSPLQPAPLCNFRYRWMDERLRLALRMREARDGELVGIGPAGSSRQIT